MKFSIYQFWAETPLIMKKIGLFASSFSQIVTLASIGSMLYGSDLRLYSHVALWSLLVGAFCKAFTECFYNEDKKC